MKAKLLSIDANHQMNEILRKIAYEQFVSQGNVCVNPYMEVYCAGRWSRVEVHREMEESGLFRLFLVVSLTNYGDWGYVKFNIDVFS